MGELKISSPVHLQTNTSTANPAQTNPDTNKILCARQGKHKWNVRGVSEGSCSAGQTLSYIHCSCPDGHSWPLPPKASLAPGEEQRDAKLPGVSVPRAAGSLPWQREPRDYTLHRCWVTNAVDKTRLWHGKCSSWSTQELALGAWSLLALHKPLKYLRAVSNFQHHWSVWIFLFSVLFFLNPGPCYAIINDSETPHQSVWTLECLKSVS